MGLGNKEGSQTAREAAPGGRANRIRLHPIASARPASNVTQNFARYVERTAESFSNGEDMSVEDVRKTLLVVRQQYDQAHCEAEQKELRLQDLRQAIISADKFHNMQGDDAGHLEDRFRGHWMQYQDTMRHTKEMRTEGKVYEHMLARIQKEQAILRQKMQLMEEHLGRKRRELARCGPEGDRVHSGCIQDARGLEALSADAEAEREACQTAQNAMTAEVQRRVELGQRRTKFERWRQDVARRSANAAFNASAGRLRKLYAIEKLSGNCLQKITFEQVERSQNTEDGFQKIREVTGLTDVMDIVHKFLNREVEHEQLKGSVKDAEVRLEALRQEFDSFKRETEGVNFTDGADKDGGIYKEIEGREQTLNEAVQEHEASRSRLQRTTLQTEHIKRWAGRVGELLAPLEDTGRVEGPGDLAPFFRRLDTGVRRFVDRVGHQLQEGRITRRTLLQVIQKDHNQQTRILSDPEFLRNNCRVPAVADGIGGRAASGGGTTEEDQTTFADDRERTRKESEDLYRQGQAEQQKRCRPKG